MTQQPPPPAPPVLELRGITKRFPGVLANDNVDLELHKGEILALLGENGAGKSTLMNVIYGLYRPDEGEVMVNGEAVDFGDPGEAIERGIGMVHQHFMLVPTLTVAENIMLGREITRGPFLDQATARQRILDLSEQYGLRVNPDAYVRDISVGAQQRAEIVKALFRGADILILDEPTAVLTPQEADDLFKVIRNLVAQGKSIIFISHKLREVLALSDRVDVLRHGRIVGDIATKDATREILASMMVGRDVNLVVEKGPADPQEVVLQVDGLRVKDDRGLMAVDDLSLTVRAGEILGVAGVQGNGQTELVEAIVGLRHVEGGTVRIAERDVTNAKPRTITELGVAHIPEDRQHDGMVGSYSIADNLVLNSYYLKPFATGMVMNDEVINEQATQLVEKFDVRTPSIRTAAGDLSGGNQQKVIVAREFSRDVKLIVAAQPTRGIDVGSIEFIHTQLVHLRDEGAGVLLVSAELDEILALADRIAVVFHGHVIETLSRDEATRDKLGLLMAGVSETQSNEGVG
ncbi:MAG: ABC transporter ATP-binding protein [Anaerolineales bacterium]|nr:ABC transporter ATP-binding protein [Anaerolineales bacterium]MCB9128091.1 ABC transporter ATP-binding protein [Ardenticatenales bacterium]MCB9172107.1 ABC transporter ATP-binding protein [Ardenticatenales bacterium]